MKRSKKRLSVIDRCIRRHYPTENTGVIADMLGEDVKYIIERARQLGVHKDRRGVSDHDEYIREHYATGNVREIAEHIGYDARDVYARAKVLGLTRRRKALSCEQRCKIAKAAAQKRKIRGANQNPVTSATETLVCSAVIRGETVEDIARDTERRCRVCWTGAWPAANMMPYGAAWMLALDFMDGTTALDGYVPVAGKED